MTIVDIKGVEAVYSNGTWTCSKSAVANLLTSVSRYVSTVRMRDRYYPDRVGTMIDQTMKFVGGTVVHREKKDNYVPGRIY